MQEPICIGKPFQINQTLLSETLNYFWAPFTQLVAVNSTVNDNMPDM